MIRLKCHFDTIMNYIYIFKTKDEEVITETVFSLKKASSSLVHQKINSAENPVSLITVKRTLSKLVDAGVLCISGKGRSVEYTVSTYGLISLPIDAHVFTSIDPDNRHGHDRLNFDLFSALPRTLFSDEELSTIEKATVYYADQIKNISATLHQKELERFVIELSWKSSKIEGNTYTLLDTEKLLRDGIRAPGKTKDEAQMILNHKEAFSFVLAHRSHFKTLSRSHLEELHKIVVKGLGVRTNIRSSPVGVTGSVYKPLDNAHQIGDAIDMLSRAVNAAKDGYNKALITLLGISYIQPFEDGNKRTARIMANAMLLAHELAPLSYRSVNEDTYREATLVFYEINSIIPFKKIFIEQYIFSANNYLIG